MARACIIKYKIKSICFASILSLCFSCIAHCVFAQQKTYFNPINIDYGYTPVPDFTIWGKHRATAAPVIVNYKNDYYLFSTNQWDIGENGIFKEQSDEN